MEISEKLQKLLKERKDRIDWAEWKKLSIEALRLGLSFNVHYLS